ncbi:Oidioi.mRNA.OKI2018_I69.PAR.g10505.t1.cds [Oikopleura dioica]|uniref:Oidioi.mRNA.OKI2018_I69.PAR.g10505.t1.cds n=1 Tax=Oikopleura dioica TaxID=34765 RepID=A0ABN7RUZ5_OIKDI|nr:Oidioi.mRNA.OKI2018_I69.PAR.g10505.t1.cds [Oikopleura dioica]
MACLLFGLKPVLVVWPSVYLWYEYTTSEDMAVDPDPTVSAFFLGLAYIQLGLHLLTITLILVSQSRDVGRKDDDGQQKKFANSRFWRVVFRLLIQYPIIPELLRGINILAIYFYYTRYLFPGQNAHVWNFVYLVATFIFLLPGILSAFHAFQMKLFPKTSFFQFYRNQWSIDPTSKRRKFHEICCQCAEYGFFMRINYYVFEVMKMIQLISLALQLILTSLITRHSWRYVQGADQLQGVKSSVSNFDPPSYARFTEPYSTRLLDNSCSSLSSVESFHIGPVPLNDLLKGKCMLPAEWVLFVFGILMISLGIISLILLVIGFDPTTEELEEKLKPEEDDEYNFITPAQRARSEPQNNNCRRISEDVTAQYNQENVNQSNNRNEELNLLVRDRVVPLQNSFQNASSEIGYVEPNNGPAYEEPYRLNQRRYSNDSFDTVTVVN